MSAFPATRWTLIDAARSGDDHAFDELVRRYHPPVVSYLGWKGLRADAEDLAQEVFLQVYHKRILDGAGPEQGRFRSLILAVTRNVVGNHLRKVNAKKRGGGKAPASLAELDPAAPPEDEEAFDRAWLVRLLEMALERLACEHPHYHDALRQVTLEGKSRQEVANALNRSPADVRNHVHRGRKKLSQYIREEVDRYAASQRHRDTELECLARLLS